eukprot:327431-Pyramimonas_sp.AAC.1
MTVSNAAADQFMANHRGRCEVDKARVQTEQRKVSSYMVAHSKEHRAAPRPGMSYPVVEDSDDRQGTSYSRDYSKQYAWTPPPPAVRMEV